jgi:hypothetical protein
LVALPKLSDILDDAVPFDLRGILVLEEPARI